MSARKTPAILIADGDKLMRWALKERLSQDYGELREAADPQSTAALLEQGADIAVVDAEFLKASDDLEKTLIAFARDHAVVLMTTDPSAVPTAFVEASACSVLEKPLRLDAVADLISAALAPITRTAPGRET